MDTAEDATGSAERATRPAAERRASDTLARVEQENATLTEQLRASRAALDASRRALELLAHPALSTPRAGAHGAFFQAVAQSVVASLGDGCTIDQVTADGLQRLAVAHADPAREGALWRACGFDPAELPQAAVLRVPLCIDEARLGVFTIWSETGRASTPQELTLAHWLGRQLALVLENRRLERVVDETREAADSLLSMVSHEIRTPLATISMSVEASMHRIEASADEVPKAWLLDRLSKVKKAVRRTDRLLHTLLGMSQAQMGRLLPDARDTDAAAIARDVVETLRDDLAWAGCQCTLLAPEPQRGKWDPIQLEIALNNLVTNAIKYAPREPLSIVVDGDEREVVLSVQDRGPGIPREQHERLFQRFYRLPSRSRAPGFGLGLWIVKHFVEANGGSVACDSEPGAGATFTLRLPRAGAKPHAGR